MEIKQISMFDILRGIETVPEEVYTARAVLTTPFANKVIPESSTFIPLALREMIKKQLPLEERSINKALTIKSGFTDAPDFIERNFWWLMLGLVLIGALIIYVQLGKIRDINADREWQKLKEEPRLKTTE
jgi:hypothetical protein